MRWDQYDELVTLLGNLTFLVRDDGEVNLDDQIKRLSSVDVHKYIWNTPTTKTVSGGVLTVDKNIHGVQPQSGTTDDIDTISGAVPNTLNILFAGDPGTDTLTLKHGTGNLSCFGGADIELSEGFVLYYYDGTTVYVAGGGGGGAPVVTTAIDGLKLTWNSATSISIGTGSCQAENGDSIDVTSVITKSSLSLSANTFYHVYAYLSGGTPSAEVVTTAPAAWKGTGYRKTGDTSRRYLGSVLTDGSGNVYPFLHHPASGAMLYVDVNQTASPFRVISSGTATSATAVACSGAVPVTAVAATLQLFNSADGIVRAGSSSGVSSTAFLVYLNVGNTAFQMGNTDVPLDSSLQIWYKYDSRTTGSFLADLYGYKFQR